MVTPGAVGPPGVVNAADVTPKGDTAVPPTFEGEPAAAAAAAADKRECAATAPGGQLIGIKLAAV